MNKTFRRFIDRLEQSRDATDLRDAMIEAAGHCDLHAFTYFRYPLDHPKDPPIYISSCPEAWVGRYMDARYDRLDPLIPKIRDNILPFEWGTAESLRGLSKAQLQIFDEGREFGIRFGITIPIHGAHGRMAALSLASEQREGDFLRLVHRYQHELHLMALHFHDHAARRLSTDGPDTPLHLSSREGECLRWAACGKTRWEIARVLGISHRTAVFHLENAKRKLAAHTTAEAVARAIHLGLL